jgi:MerR family transcriptional regulator, heat shock protein HspR
MSDQITRSRLIRLEVAAEAVRLSHTQVRRYVRAGLVRPAHVEGAEALFGDEELARLRKIRRLREDLGLNQAGLEVVLRLLDEVQELRVALAQRDRSQGAASQD